MQVPRVYYKKKNRCPEWHQHMSLQVSELLKLSLSLAKSNSSFLICWNKNFHISYSSLSGFRSNLIANFDKIGERFVNTDKAYFTLDSLAHSTLFQDTALFEGDEKQQKLLAIPIYDQQRNVIGMFGNLYAANQAISYDFIEGLIGIARHIELLYLNNELNGAYKPKEIGRKANLMVNEHIPVEEFKFTTNLQNEIKSISIEADMREKLYLIFKKDSLNTDKEIVRYIQQLMQSRLTRKSVSQAVEGKTTIPISRRDNAGQLQHYLLKINPIQQQRDLCTYAIKLNKVQLDQKFNEVLEQIIFDISHVMRRPVATMLGLTNLIEMHEADELATKEITSKLQLVSEEMDSYIKGLYHKYQVIIEENSERTLS